MNPNRQAWAAFLLSSALIVGTLLPIVNYGGMFLYFPIFLLFGCDGAGGSGDCLRIQLTPFIPPILAILSLIFCRIAIKRAWYTGSVLLAALACGGSWAMYLSGAR